MTGLRYILEMVITSATKEEFYYVDGYDTLAEPKRLLESFHGEMEEQCPKTYYEGWIIRMSTGETVAAVRAERV